jgi:hypothetical protein
MIYKGRKPGRERERKVTKREKSEERAERKRESRRIEQTRGEAGGQLKKRKSGVGRKLTQGDYLQIPPPSYKQKLGAPLQGLYKQKLGAPARNL